MQRLVVRIEEPGGNGEDFPVSVYCERTGGAEWLTQPVHQGDIKHALTDAESGWDATRAITRFLETKGQSEHIDEAGAFLGKLLDQSGAGQYIRDEHNASVAGDETTHFRLILDVEPPALRVLPWELLRWGNTRCFIDANNPACRSGLERLDRKLEGIKPPIRILIAVGALNAPGNGGDYAKIDPEDEVLAIQSALSRLGRLVEVNVLHQPNKVELEKAIATDKPHIFHFCGHGGTYENKPSLFLWDSAAEMNQAWTAQAIALTLKIWVPRVVFLNACKTSSADVQANVSSIAAEFIKAGCAAVVGTNSNIKNSTAAQFAKSVYTALANGKDIDEAIASARFDVQSSRGVDDREWATPALHLGAAPEAVLELDFKPDPELKKCTEFKSLHHLVDRHDPRRLLWRGVDPAFEAGLFGDFDATPLTVVTGPDSVGKSWTVFWALSVCMLRGHRPVYVNMDDNKGKSFLDVLRLIRDGDPSSPSPLRAALPAPVFSEFNWALKHLGEGKKPPRLPKNAGDIKDDLKKTYEGGEDSFTQLFTPYREALKTVAAERPLIIALDQLKRLEPQSFIDPLWKNLFQWIAAGDLPNVRMVLVTNPGEYKAFDLGDHEGEFTKVDVRGFPASAYKDLVLEYLIYRNTGLAEAKQYRDFFAARRKEKPSDWLPKHLEDIYRVVSEL